MQLKEHGSGTGKIAEVLSDEIILKTVQDSLDLMAEVDSHDSKKIIIYKENITPEFFNLTTGLAGEILQKYVNYQFKLAIVGDFTKHSKNFNAFVLECNRGSQFFFVPGLEEALKRFNGVKG